MFSKIIINIYNYINFFLFIYIIISIGLRSKKAYVNKYVLT